jgi:hypothetical protein
MTDGRQILAELQASGLADTDLDYDEVMAELAAGRSAMTVIGRQRHQSSLFVRFKPGERQLVDDLTAIARAPFVALPWPTPPPVAFDRLSADLERTTGRRLQLALRWEQYPDVGYWVCDVTLDSRGVGSCGVETNVDNPEAYLVAVADRVCEQWLHEEVWGGWPMCARHPSRPMWAKLNSEGIATWECEKDVRDEVVIGRLGLQAAPQA